MQNIKFELQNTKQEMQNTKHKMKNTKYKTKGWHKNHSPSISGQLNRSSPPLPLQHHHHDYHQTPRSPSLFEPLVHNFHSRHFSHLRI